MRIGHGRSGFNLVLDEAQALACEKKRKFRFKNPLYSLDTSTITLCLKTFNWVYCRRAKGVITLHMLLDHYGYLPCWAFISNAKNGDSIGARLLSLPSGAIVAVDRGYTDFRLFASWCEAGVYFVTRMKEATVYRVEEAYEVPKGGYVLSDERIRFTGIGAMDKCPYLLRRVVVLDAVREREIVLLTNTSSCRRRRLATATRTVGRTNCFLRR